MKKVTPFTGINKSKQDVSSHWLGVSSLLSTNAVETARFSFGFARSYT